MSLKKTLSQAGTVPKLPSPSASAVDGHENVMELSGGELQKVAIAVCLAAKPTVFARRA